MISHRNGCSSHKKETIELSSSIQWTKKSAKIKFFLETISSFINTFSSFYEKKERKKEAYVISMWKFKITFPVVFFFQLSKPSAVAAAILFV